jgi:hypothetical protein
MKIGKFETTLKITATVLGYEYGRGEYDEKTKETPVDRSNFQIQTLVKKDNGLFDKQTIRVHKEVAEEALDKMIGKNFTFTGAKEIKVEFKKFYSATDFKEAKPTDEPIFELDSTGVMDVHNVVQMTDKEGRTINEVKIQVSVMDGKKLDIKTVKLKGFKLEQIKPMENKKVLLKELKIYPMDYVTYYNTEALPEVIK